MGGSKELKAQMGGSRNTTFRWRSEPHSGDVRGCLLLWQKQSKKTSVYFGSQFEEGLVYHAREGVRLRAWGIHSEEEERDEYWYLASIFLFLNIRTGYNAPAHIYGGSFHPSSHNLQSPTQSCWDSCFFGDSRTCEEVGNHHQPSRIQTIGSSRILWALYRSCFSWTPRLGKQYYVCNRANSFPILS